MRYLIICLSLIASIASANINQVYQFNDLEKLVKSSSFDEFFLHMNDIKPSQRNTEWTDLVLDAVKRYSNQLIDNELIDRNSFKLFRKLSLNNDIGSNDVFIYKYYQIAIEYFRNCIDDKCSREIQSFWKHSNKNHDLAANLFEIYKSRNEIDPWLFVEKMALTSVNKTHCAKPEVQKILFENLIKKHDELDKPYSAILTAYLNPVCFDKLRPFLKKVFSSKLETRNSAFLILDAKDELTTTEKDVFYTQYILNTPKAGSLFDKAWSNTLELSGSFQRRSRIISKFDTMAIIPDGILNSKDIKKIDTIYNFINSQFPELIDYYATSCINYYKGTKVYINGNPTLNCKKFFKVFKSKSWLSDNHKVKFSDLKLL